jgi:radical SAM superfamily enzyme YgiQ (UPF0313 family)
LAKVLLLSPPSRATTPRPPLGLMYVSSSLSRNGIDNDIIDIKGQMNIDKVLAETLRLISGSDTDIIGISCLVTEIEIVEEMCRKIKELKPKTTIVLGGAQPSTHPEHFDVAKEYIDYFVMGEGEITFPELVTALRDGRNTKDIKGLAWFESGLIVKSPPRELIKDLDTLPPPAYDKVDMARYTRPTSWGVRPVPISLFWMFSSRGCPFQCNYCVAHEIFGKRVQQRSPGNLVDEIELLVNAYNLDGIYFFDESFTINSKRVIEICREIRKRGIKIVFGCQTRVDLISEDVVAALAEAGCIQIDFGIESGSDRMLKAIRKGVTVEQIKKALRLCKKYGIRIFANMMVNLPGETEEDLKESIDLMREITCNVVIWNVTVPYPGGFLDMKIEREDYRKLINFPSDEGYDLLETKYRLAQHDRNLRGLVDELHSIFPHPRYINKMRLNADYIWRCFLFIDFIFKPKYLMMLLRSRRKLQYLLDPIIQPKHN